MVRLLGDGVMFHFAAPGDAVACALELVATAEDSGLPPARVGLHAGARVTRGGDYFGQTVNLAARIAEDARPREVPASGAVVRLAEGAADHEAIGDIGLRGVTEPVVLFRALNRDTSPSG